MASSTDHPTTPDPAPESGEARVGFMQRDWWGLGLPTDPVRRVATLVGAIAVVVMVMVARSRLEPYTAFDASHFVIGWFNWLRSHGFDFSQRFSDYNVPYLYLLWLTSQFTSSGILGIKLVSNFGDVVLAVGVYRVIRHFTGPRWALAGAFLVLVIPTTWLNSAVWGQTDQLYAAVAIHALAWALRDRQRLAWIAFGVAFSFKLQAIFILPFFVLFWLRTPKRSWAAPGYALLAWFVAFIPAMIGGASLRQLMLTYSEQTAGGQTTVSANLWKLFDLTDRDFQSMMVPFAAAVVGAMMVAALIKDDWYHDRGRWLSLAAATSLVLPYLLPTMRNRYFYLPEVLAFLVAFARPKMWWVSMLAVITGSFGYSVALFAQPVAFGHQASAIPYFVVLMALIRDAFGLTQSSTTKSGVTGDAGVTGDGGRSAAATA